MPLIKKAPAVVSMEVKITGERDVGNGESSVKINFSYTKEDLQKATTTQSVVAERPKNTQS